MEIILIRHGEPEENREGLEDLQRHLTEKGKEEMQKLMPELKERLEPVDERTIVLWSSPAERAIETAQIVADELQTPINSIHDFIYEGDFEPMSHEVQKVNDHATLLMVGHQPNLSEWTKYMTGEDVEIGKGDMLNFKVTKQLPLEAELQWKITND
jgi:phosphohistidine phosphatase SixA